MGQFDYLKGQLPSELISILEDEATRKDTDAEPTFAKRTTEVLRVYANGTTGNDSNSGLRVDDAKKTIQAVANLIPEACSSGDFVWMHLGGTFSESDASLRLSKTINDTELVIDGGTELTTVAGPWTADINSASAIGFTGAGLTPDQWSGYIVEVISGAQAGAKRTIWEHDATTLQPAFDFFGDPGLATFRIARPSTTISVAGSPPIAWYLGCQGSGRLYVQRLYFEGGDFLIDSFNQLFDAVFMSSVMNISGSWTTGFHDTKSSLSNFALNSALDIWGIDLDWAGCGFSQVGTRQLDMARTKAQIISSAFFRPGMELNRCEFSVDQTFQGCRSLGLLEFFNCTTAQRRALGFGVSAAGGAGFRSAEIDGAAAQGIIVDGGQIGIKNATIKDCGSHAIEVRGGTVFLKEGVVGTGNTGAGLYAHRGAMVHIDDGDAPTVTGTVGDVSTDGTTEATTWAAVDAGTPFVDASEGGTLIKEV